MLLIEIKNDGTGKRGFGNYDWRVLVTESPTKLVELAKGRVEDHPRHHGWGILARRVADAAYKADQREIIEAIRKMEVL